MTQSRPPLTPRLKRIATMWQDAPRPANIVAPGPGQESVWDYPRPPRLDDVRDTVQVEHAGVVIGKTTRALRVAETSSPPCYYIPPDDIDWHHVEPTSGRSMCEWKGTAAYFSIRVGPSRVERAAWSYPTPYEEYADLRNYLAFYANRVDRCTVGGAVVVPQPGEFYGGWVTPNLVGPFKGSPGSQGW